jgi:hypothetical protein
LTSVATANEVASRCSAMPKLPPFAQGTVSGVLAVLWADPVTVSDVHTWRPLAPLGDTEAAGLIELAANTDSTR